ncbi:hypothetical protein REPUB_Repub14bG0085600 [Reevesia pubescens]
MTMTIKNTSSKRNSEHAASQTDKELEKRSEDRKRGYVLIVSLPMVVFFILLCFACNAMGRKKGIEEGSAMVAQELGINPQSSQTMVAVAVADGVMAPGTLPSAPPPHQYPAAFPSPSPHHPNQAYLKQQNGINVV